MKFRHELERWHKIKDFTKMLHDFASFHERQEIRKCKHYEFDNQSSEDYCWHPKHQSDNGLSRTMPLDGDSHVICWKCPSYEVEVK